MVNPVELKGVKGSTFQLIYISVCEYMTEPLIKNLKLLWN